MRFEFHNSYKTPKSSAVSNHLLLTSHNADMEDFSIICRDPSRSNFELLLRKSLLIYRDHPSLNKKHAILLLLSQFQQHPPTLSKIHNSLINPNFRFCRGGIQFLDLNHGAISIFQKECNAEWLVVYGSRKKDAVQRFTYFR